MAAEMRLRDASGGGGGGGGGPAARAAPQWSRWRRRRPRALARGCHPSLPQGGGEKGSASPPPDRDGPSSAEPPWSAGRLGAWRFMGLGSSGPNAEEGRVPSVLGGAVHRRVVGGPEFGRAPEAGRARRS